MEVNLMQIKEMSRSIYRKLVIINTEHQWMHKLMAHFHVLQKTEAVISIQL